MMMKTMPIDAAASQSGAVRDRASGKAGSQNSGQGGGFSDVLGNVGGEGRRQPGLTGSSGNDTPRGMDAGEFRYTQKASEAVRASDLGDPSQGQRMIAADNGTMFDESVADKILAQAAQIVTQTVRETGEAPARPEAAAMLTDALKDIKVSYSENVEPKADETQPADDTASLIDALIRAVTAVSDDSGQETEEAAEVAADDEAPADTSDKKAQFTPSPRAKAADMPAKARPARTDATDDSSETDKGFDARLMTADMPETDLTAMFTAVQMTAPADVNAVIETAMPEMTVEAAETTVPEYIPKDVTRDIPETVQEYAGREQDAEMPQEIPLDIPKFEDVMAAKAAESEPIPEFNEARDLPRGYSVIKEMFAAPDKGLPVRAPEMPVTDEDAAAVKAVNDTLMMLGRLIDDAKKELGLTEVRIEYTEGDAPQETLPLMPNEHVKLSRQMSGSDRTGELDHILNEDRADVSDKQAQKTETYDAVRMSEQLFGRTEPRLTAGAQVEFRDEAQIVARPPEVQVTEQILSRMDEMQAQQKDRTEFTMVLNPESLGKITVKLVMTGEKTAVEISAENPDTRALLASRSEALQNMLKDNGVQLERYQVVSEQEDARFDQQSYEGSSKNPYSRNDGQRQSDDDEGGNGNSFYDLLQSI